ncbi:MAG: M48 family metallopeptidase [Acidobacteriota bacterium]
MAEQGAVGMVCPNGHGGFAAGSQVCMHCGARLVAGAAAAPRFPPAAVYPPAPGPPPAPPSPAPGYAPVIGAPAPPPGCGACGGNGVRLPVDMLVCPECHWLRPLAPGYAVDPAAFVWGQDGSAMARLRSIGPINSAARAISDKVGRRWIESTFNAVRLGEKQVPGVWRLSVHAARVLGMPTMPDVYLSGDRMWEAATYGSDTNSFVVVGTALLSNFQGPDLLFLLAREMGHCRAGHALWKTVIRFLLGEQGPRKGLGGGLLEKLNPAALVEGALELPLLAWARQAEITADRAGMLALGDEDVARRVLLSWCLKSAVVFRQINIQAWLEQMDDGDDQMTRLSEVASSATPYITRRLKLLAQYANSQELKHYRSVIEPLARGSELAAGVRPSSGMPSQAPPTSAQAQVPGRPPTSTPAPAPVPAPAPDDLRLACPTCKAPMRIPRAVLAGKEVVNVRCPGPDCRRLVTLRRQPAAAPKPAPLSARQLADEGQAEGE